MAELRSDETRATRLERTLRELLSATTDLEAAAVVSFDGLPMAASLPAGMDEDRVAAMSAALLSLGERATEGLGRGALNQVFIEGENGTVFLVSAEDEAVLVAVATKGAKTGLMLYEVKRAAAQVADALRQEPSADHAVLSADDLPPLPELDPVAPNGTGGYAPPPTTYVPYAAGSSADPAGSAWS